MACGCSGTCSCVVTGIGIVSVTGSGTAGNPYVVSSTGGGTTLETVDTYTVDTTLNSSNQVVLVDSTAAPVEITLPAIHSSGQRYDIKDYGATGSGNTTVNAVTIDPNGNNIDGSGAIITLLSDGDSYTLISNGTDWGIL